MSVRRGRGPWADPVLRLADGETGLGNSTHGTAFLDLVTGYLLGGGGLAAILIVDSQRRKIVVLFMGCDMSMESLCEVQKFCRGKQGVGFVVQSEFFQLWSEDAA